MFIKKIKDKELIFDCEQDFHMLQTLSRKIGIRRKGSLGVWVDNSNGTAYAQIHRFGKNIKVHHLFAGVPLHGCVVDHINGNSLDNRRSNLRVCTRNLNGYNKKRSGIALRWVTKQKNGRYQVQVRIGLGTYATEEEAFSIAFNFLNKYHGNLIIPEGESNVE